MMMKMNIDRDLESHLIITQLQRKRDRLTQLYSNYAITSAIELEQKIADGTVNEHPAYEDYLTMVSLEKEIQEIKQLAQRLIEVM